MADAIAELADATALLEPADAAASLLLAMLTEELAEDGACDADVWIASKAEFANSAESCAEVWAIVARLMEAAACCETEATC